MAVVLANAGCSAPPPPASFQKTWKPLHVYTPDVQVLPFHKPHYYAADPADRTLRNLLQRWASEAGASLSYEVAADFTLSVPVGHIRTQQLERALTCLDRIYRPYGAEVAWQSPNVMVVRVAGANPVDSQPPVDCIDESVASTRSPNSESTRSAATTTVGIDPFTH